VSQPHQHIPFSGIVFFSFRKRINAMNIWNRPDRIPEIYGTLIAVGLIVYFLAMYAIGLAHQIELRLVNLVILLAGVYFALKQYRRTHHGHLNYFRGLAIGVSATTIGVSTFALLLFIFLKVDKDIMNTIIRNEPMGHYLNPYIAAAAIMIEGVMSGFFVTFVLLNWIYTDRVSDPVGSSEG
jgi:hypothetical protein